LKKFATALALLIATTAFASGVAVARHSSSHHGAATRYRVLLGDRRIARTSDYNPATEAQAFLYRAIASGSASHAEVYVDSGSLATHLKVGLYSDHRGKPSILLASGALSAPRSGAWNEVRLSRVQLREGRRYWIALQGTGGKLSYRDTGHGSASYATRSGLRSMPRRFVARSKWRAGPASVYVFQGSPPRSAATPAAPAPAPPPGAGSPAPPSGTIPPGGCLPDPSACGFPDATNTGIAGCPPLQPSGGITADTPNQTYQDLDVSGTVQINAANVTLNCVRITDNDPQGDTNYVLSVSDGANALIEHTEINGQAGNQDACIDGSGFTLDYVNVHGCVDAEHVGWDVTVENSYVHDNATSMSSPHYDGLQWIGCSTCSDAPANWNDVVRHNTIYPGRGDTSPWTNSAIFVQAANGPIGGVTIDDNLLDGGGYTVFVDSQNGYPTPSNVSFTDNRFGTHYHFGISSVQNPAPAWSGNVHDATGAPISSP
jgi:hypothetical protein